MNEHVKLMVENIIQIKSGITINVDVNIKIHKKIMHVEKIIFGTGSFEHGKYVANIINDSMITTKVFHQNVLQQKLFQQKLFQQKNTSRNFYVYKLFFNYDSIIDGC